MSVLSPPELDKTERTQYRIGMTRESATWRLRFRLWRARWMPENPRDRVRTTYTDLVLCDPCGVDVWDFAYTKVERNKGDGISQGSGDSDG